MFKKKIQKLLDDYGVKQEAIIETMESNRVAFGKKMRDNTFTELDRQRILDKYGSLLV